MDNLSSENKKGPLGTSVQVRLTAQDIIFGPGKAMLLEYIEATGSIQEACARMELSYSKGSRMIKKAEKQLENSWASACWNAGSEAVAEAGPD